jgi:D-3-phosphoglycerate dehydrogenase
MKIAVLDDYQHAVPLLDCFALLSGHQVKIFSNSARGIGQLAIRLAEFDALVLNRERTPISKTLLEKLPKLKLIAQVGKVGSHIDVTAATARGVAVAEGVQDVHATAELTWALIMAATRKIPQYSANLKMGAWQAVSSSPQLNTLGVGLKGRKLGIWGYGKTGRLIAGYGKAFGMQVTIWGGEASCSKAQADGYAVAPSKAALFADSDVLSLHLRLAESTRGIVTGEDLARMKPSALFVNTSHAELVTSGALVEALQHGCPGSAALDVFETEPLNFDSPLLKMANVLTTPHIGYVEKDSYEILYGSAFQNIIDFANGNPQNIINPEVFNLETAVDRSLILGKQNGH